jgi:hypothetical protein
VEDWLEPVAAKDFPSIEQGIGLPTNGPWTVIFKEAYKLDITPPPNLFFIFLYILYIYEETN